MVVPWWAIVAGIWVLGHLLIGWRDEGLAGGAWAILLHLLWGLFWLVALGGILVGAYLL